MLKKTKYIFFSVVILFFIMFFNFHITKFNYQKIEDSTNFYIATNYSSFDKTLIALGKTFGRATKAAATTANPTIVPATFFPTPDFFSSFASGAAVGVAGLANFPGLSNMLDAVFTLFAAQKLTLEIELTAMRKPPYTLIITLSYKTPNDLILTE